jgi:hypothetical protein
VASRASSRATPKTPKTREYPALPARARQHRQEHPLASHLRNPHLDDAASDAGSQYTWIDYTQTLDDYGVLASIGTVGDAYDNAIAESLVDSFNT